MVQRACQRKGVELSASHLLGGAQGVKQHISVPIPSSTPCLALSQAGCPFYHPLPRYSASCPTRKHAQASYSVHLVMSSYMCVRAGILILVNTLVIFVKLLFG